VNAAAALIAVVAALHAAPAPGQAWPQKAIRIIVPVPPGGGNDTLARIVAQKISDSVRQPVVIDNRPGGNTTIGTAALAKSPPDGYTLLSAPSAHTVNPVLFKSLPYDPIRDFTPVAGVASTPLFCAVHPSLPVRSVKDLVALAKARPGELTYASPGNGTSGHLAAELFKSVAGVKMVHVPYKGGAQALTDTVAGNTQAVVNGMLATLPMVKTGKLKVIAVSSKARQPQLPNVPTIAENGLPGYDHEQWYALFAPARTPVPLVQALHREVTRIVKTPEINERLLATGHRVVAGTPEQLADRVKREIDKTRQIMQASGMQQQ
jgi:tripartite-type tricarboxylate transporter receptor subunit TctC